MWEAWLLLALDYREFWYLSGVCFFFSSRRRHTRYWRDWSSDVCSSDLARPGGNITGVSNLAVALTGKWLEYLKQIVPTLSQVAVLRNAANPTHALFWAEAQSAAPRLGLQLQSVEVRTPDDLDGAFATIVRERSAAVVVLPDPLLAGFLRGRIAELATRNRLPAVYTFKEQADAGGLLSYGPSLSVN